MMSEVQLLVGERQKGESNKAVIACNDWLRMGPGRSLPALLEKYNQTQQDAAPSRSLNTLQRWSSDFNWFDRATSFDANWEAIKTAEREAELNYGLALDYERVRKLKRMADFLEGQLYETGAADAETGKAPYHNVWLPDVKVVGSGDSAETVDIERFNSAIFIQLRGVLDDLAQETGGRIKKIAPTDPTGEKPYDALGLSDEDRANLVLGLIHTGRARDSEADS